VNARVMHLLFGATTCSAWSNSSLISFRLREIILRAKRRVAYLPRRLPQKDVRYRLLSDFAGGDTGPAVVFGRTQLKFPCQEVLPSEGTEAIPMLRGVPGRQAGLA